MKNLLFCFLILFLPFYIYSAEPLVYDKQQAGKTINYMALTATTKGSIGNINNPLYVSGAVKSVDIFGKEISFITQGTVNTIPIVWVDYNGNTLGKTDNPLACYIVGYPSSSINLFENGMSNPFYTKIVDQNENTTLAIDNDGAVVQIDNPHYYARKGKRYSASYSFPDVDTGNSAMWYFTPNGTSSYLNAFVSSNGAGYFQFYATTNGTIAGGTTMTAQNDLWASSNNPTAKCYYGGVSSTTNVLINEIMSGSSGIGNNATRKELIPNSYYIVKWTSTADNVRVNCTFDWYEK